MGEAMECKTAFRQIDLNPDFSIFCFTTEFILKTDACKQGFIIILSQKEYNDKLYAIEYACRADRPIEAKAKYSFLNL